MKSALVFLRSLRRGMLACSAVCLALTVALSAMYMLPDLVNVPIDRLIANLEKLAAGHPDDVESRLNLARTHMMAFALKTDTAKVQRGDDTHGPYRGYEPSIVQEFQVQPAADAKTAQAAREHLTTAIATYEAVLKMSPTNMPARLGHAWAIDKSVDRTRAILLYRGIVNDAWPVESKMTTAGLGWQSVTAETASYLIPLLDPVKDKDEIATLQDHIAQMRRVNRPITPIAIPLRAGLTAEAITNNTARVHFDADGSGRRDAWTWITSDAAWLTYRRDLSRPIGSALQLFGNVTFWLFWDNGYHALRALDDNGDGRLRGEELRGLGLWHDANADGISDAGELMSLTDAGIVELSCAYQLDPRHPDEIAFSPSGAIFADGSSRPTYDIVLHRQSR